MSPAPGRRWAAWDRFAAAWGLDARRPPLRALLIWDNLAGHKAPDLERRLLDHGILPPWTPLAGYTGRPISRCRHEAACTTKGYGHGHCSS